jgi:Phosphatidylinositol 3- and 4-kinase
MQLSPHPFNCCCLFRYLKVELEDPTFGARYREVFDALEVRLSQTPFSGSTMRATQPSLSTSGDVTTQFTKSIVDSVSKIGSSLRKVEIQSTPNDSDQVAQAKSSDERTMWGVLVEQDKFISGVLEIQLRCRDSRGKKDAKEAELRSLLSKEGFDRKDSRDPVPLPSRPDIFVNGVRPETAIMFKSALYPALLEFHVEGTMPTKDHDLDTTGSFTSYKVIVKTGDDLRQDQLVIMMIQLMDGLLKRGALDLCLTPYSIIATSTTSGLVEFVDKSMPISQVLSKYNGSIMQFLQSVASQKGAKYDIQPDAMSAYIRSCAGYCVITYLLGVGDRHLDNIMLRTSGHFFHIDFGFIFGRDPKPLPPAFRLTREVSFVISYHHSNNNTHRLTLSFALCVDGGWYGWI